MKKLSKKLLSVLLVIAMLVPTGALTVQTSAETTLNIGDIIEFGTYPQTEVTDSSYVGETVIFNDKTYSVEPIKWRVLNVSDGKALLLTDKIINGKRFNSTSATVDGYTGNDYSNSEIREWLNNEFYNTAFSNNELNAIVSTKTESTTDNVFLLSKYEADSYATKYFSTTATDYAYGNGFVAQSSTELCNQWWTRTAASSSYSLYYVQIRWGKWTTYYNWYDDVITCPKGVRPAIYLDVDAWESGADVSGEHFPDGYDPVLDKYGFTNPSQVVESEIYKTVYGTVKGSLLSFVHENRKAHGLCYGMASTTAALLQNRTAISSFSLLSPDMNLGNVEFISNIYEDAYSSVFNMDTISFVKYGYVYQFATERDSTINNLNGLYSAVRSYVDGNGDGVVISIWHGTKYNRDHGHAILATGIKETADAFIILIDDSNFWTQTELSISKDFSSWNYSVDGVTLSDGTAYNYNSSNGIIGYDIPGRVVYNLGLLAGEHTRTATNYLNANRLLVTSTDTIVENDNLSEIFTTDDADSSSNNSLKLYWTDEDMNGIELSAVNNDSEVTVSDVNSSVSIVLDSKENASFYVDDEMTNKVSYSSKNNENANIVFTSVDEQGGIVTTTLTGTANGNEVTATETDNGIQVTGLNDITVTYETADGTGKTRANIDDGSTVNITVDDTSNTVTTDWNCKHEDVDHDGVCDVCAEDFTKNCSHLCHNDNAFVQFVWKIINFLYRIFGTNQYCDCGNAHW